MRKLCVFLLIILSLFSLTGCKTVAVTSADELTFFSWQAQTKSQMSAMLVFSGNQARFTVYDCDKKVLSCIEGAFAVDENNLYITDCDLYKTYTFGYKMYGDRAEIKYLGETLDFYPIEPLDKTG